MVGSFESSVINRPDTFELWYHPPPEANETSIRVPFSVEGVLSKAERKKKFKNPENNPKLVGKYPGTGCDQFTNVVFLLFSYFPKKVKFREPRSPRIGREPSVIWGRIMIQTRMTSTGSDGP